MPRLILSLSFLLAGLALIALGLSWHVIFPVESVWSNEQAQEYTDASLALKTAASHPEESADENDDSQLDAARERFDKIKAELGQAIQWRESSGVLLGIGGTVLMAIGAAIYLSGQAAKPETPQDR